MKELVRCVSNMFELKLSFLWYDSYRVSDMNSDVRLPGTSQDNAYDECESNGKVSDSTLPKERLKTHNPSDVSEITTSGPYEQVNIQLFSY